MLGVDVPARQGRHSAVHSEFLQERGQPPAAWSRDREASPSVCEDLSSTDHLHLERGWPPVDGARNGVTAPVDDGLVFVAGDPSLCDLDRPDSQAPAKLVRLEALLAKQKEVLAACTKHYSCMAAQLAAGRRSPPPPPPPRGAPPFWGGRGRSDARRSGVGAGGQAGPG